MPVLLETSPAFARNVAGIRHPVAPETLDAMASGIGALDLGDDLIRVEPRCMVMLEGGCDLDALAGSAAACAAVVAGLDHRPEEPTSGGPGADVVEAAARLRGRR